MDRFLSNLPIGAVAVGALALILFVIVQFNPWTTVCDEQMELLRSSQAGFLFAVADGKTKLKPRFEELTSRCRFRPGPGGCAELFDKLRRLSTSLDSLSARCDGDAARSPELQRALFDAIELFAALAWGEDGPRSYAEKSGWLASSEIDLFCRLRARSVALFGKESAGMFLDRALSALPGADKLTRDQAYERSLFSAPCLQFR